MTATERSAVSIAVKDMCLHLVGYQFESPKGLWSGAFGQDAV